MREGEREGESERRGEERRRGGEWGGEKWENVKGSVGS